MCLSMVTEDVPIIYLTGTLRFTRPTICIGSMMVDMPPALKCRCRMGKEAKRRTHQSDGYLFNDGAHALRPGMQPRAYKYPGQ